MNTTTSSGKSSVSGKECGENIGTSAPSPESIPGAWRVPTSASQANESATKNPRDSVILFSIGVSLVIALPLMNWDSPAKLALAWLFIPRLIYVAMYSRGWQRSANLVAAGGALCNATAVIFNGFRMPVAPDLCHELNRLHSCMNASTSVPYLCDVIGGFSIGDIALGASLLLWGASAFLDSRPVTSEAQHA